MALLVDPYLKVELVDDVARGMWQHMIGFDHEPEIKERLKNIAFETKVYRRNLNVIVEVMPHGDKTTLQCSLDCVVINPSPESERYQPSNSFDEYEQPNSVKMSLRSVEDKSASKRAGESRLDSQEPGISKWVLNRIALQPQSKYLSHTQYSVTFPRDFYFVLNMGIPTIGISIRIEAPAECEVTLAPKTEHRVDDARIWDYPQLFMRDEHIHIRWKFNHAAISSSSSVQM